MPKRILPTTSIRECVSFKKRGDFVREKGFYMETVSARSNVIKEPDVSRNTHSSCVLFSLSEQRRSECV